MEDNWTGNVEDINHPIMFKVHISNHSHNFEGPMRLSIPPSDAIPCIFFKNTLGIGNKNIFKVL